MKVLGKPGEHNTEIHAILAEYGLPSDFPIEVEVFAQNLDTSITEEEIAKRRANYQKPTPKATRGVLAKFAKLTRPASEGCVTDL